MLERGDQGAQIVQERVQKSTDRREFSIAAIVMGWIGLVLVLAGGEWPLGEVIRQLVLGAATWAVLVALLAREPLPVRIQTALVVVFATLVEYTFSPLLQAYVYKIGTVPLYVPPGHGLVYLGALALGRSPSVKSRQRALIPAVVLIGGAWAGYGLLGARHDVLGAFWFLCLLGFLRWGRSTLLYVGAFVVVSYLELVGTALGTWAWAVTDPVLHRIGQGNPPSGAAGGYGWFDLYAQMLAPSVGAWWLRSRGRPEPRREVRRSWRECS
jgi:hypothetical protein